MFKVFQVSTQNLEKNSKNDVFRVISFAFKFEFVTFKPNLNENVPEMKVVGF